MAGFIPLYGLAALFVLKRQRERERERERERARCCVARALSMTAHQEVDIVQPT